MGVGFRIVGFWVQVLGFGRLRKVWVKVYNETLALPSSLIMTAQDYRIWPGHKIGLPYLTLNLQAIISFLQRSGSNLGFRV